MRLKIFLLVCLVAEIYSDDRKEEPELGVEPAIIGGHPASPNQFPYLVAIQARTARPGGHINDEQLCGGVIIDARWVLTSAHCYEHGNKLVIKAGKYDISKKENHEQTIVVKKVIIHKDHHKKLLENDIALLLLETRLKFNEHVAKIDLPASDGPPTGAGVLAGWGVISPHAIAFKSAILQAVSMPIIDLPTCIKLADKFEPKVLQSQFCAKGHPPGVGGCLGDSGGPFVLEKDGRKELVGIFSRSVFPCGTRDSVDVFTKVSHFKKWIQEVMHIHSHE